jgi:hypothetical protein
MICITFNAVSWDICIVTVLTAPLVLTIETHLNTIYYSLHSNKRTMSRANNSKIVLCIVLANAYCANVSRTVAQSKRVQQRSNVSIPRAPYSAITHAYSHGRTGTVCARACRLQPGTQSSCTFPCCPLLLLRSKQRASGQTTFRREVCRRAYTRQQSVCLC